MSAINQLAELLAESRVTAVLTGAGISTDSGIPDFRSPGGVWTRYQPVMYDDFLSCREDRIRYWRMRHELYGQFKDARPNAGHVALARMEQMGHLHSLTTQNIDGLHQDAGSRNVIEIHGTARYVRCVTCRADYPAPVIHERIEAGCVEPLCDECGGLLKSRTISFGQAMPAEELMMAAQWARKSDVYLAIGTSLTVQPAASLPMTACENGAKLVVINATGTMLDGVAVLTIREPLSAALSAVVEALEAFR